MSHNESKKDCHNGQNMQTNRYIFPTMNTHKNILDAHVYSKGWKLLNFVMTKQKLSFL
jgi:hypothetical protein